MTQIAMLAALSLVLVTFVHFPIFPTAPFLEYDMADVPVLIGGFLLGPIEGLAILLVVSVYQAFALGGNGWVGLVMHFVASGLLVVISAVIFRWKKTVASMIIGLILGCIAMTAAMIPMNLTLTVYFLGTPREVVEQMMLPVIIPFNLIKSSANSTLAALVYFPLKRLVKLTEKA